MVINYLRFKIRAVLRRLILNILGYRAIPSSGIYILAGHMICRKNPRPEIFEAQLKTLSKFVKFIRFEDAVERIMRHETPSETLVAFSFDDGFEECATMISPVLEKFGVNAAFFINPNFVSGNDDYIEEFTNKTTLSPGKKPMRWGTIKELSSRGHIIGAHTLDHYMINDDNIVELERQIGECKTVIEEKLGAECKYFAFPYGRLEHANPLSIDIACKYYPYVFSLVDDKRYFSFGNRVINRRHFEPDWPSNHLKYFLSRKKEYKN